jgi:hypothetical protein
MAAMVGLAAVGPDVSSHSLTVVSVTSSRKSHGGLAGLQLLLPQPAGQVVIAVRLRALLPGAPYAHSRNE